MSVRHTNRGDEDAAKQNYENAEVSRERRTYQQAADHEYQHGGMDVKSKAAPAARVLRSLVIAAIPLSPITINPID
jgi:hypothetical protein